MVSGAEEYLCSTNMFEQFGFSGTFRGADEAFGGPIEDQDADKTSLQDQEDDSEYEMPESGEVFDPSDLGFDINVK